MRTLSAAAVLALSVTLSAHAQLSQLPDSSTLDGIFVQAPGQNAAWSGTALGHYRMAPDNPFTAPGAGNQDAHGVTWGTSAPNRDDLAQFGGALRTIFLGSMDPWTCGVGYCYDGMPANGAAYTLGDSLGNPVGPFTFGDHADISLFPGEASTFDLWLSTGSGVYTLLAPENSESQPDVQSRILWTQSPLLVSTYLPDFAQPFAVKTWIVSITEQVGNDPALEYRMALQQYIPTGAPLAPVPEPSTYALAGAVACLLLALRRRFRRR